MQAAGATVVDLDAEGFRFPPGTASSSCCSSSSWTTCGQYFATRVGVPMAGKTLADLIAYNEANAAIEMPYLRAGDLRAGSGARARRGYAAAAARRHSPTTRRWTIDQNAGVNGIDTALSKFNLDAIATPTGRRSWTTDLINGDHFEFATSGLAAIVGYPIVNVPMGHVFGLRSGISFIGTAFSEPALIGRPSGFEHATRARFAPRFFPTLPLDNVSGVPLRRRRKGTGHHSGQRRHHHCL